jgi:threonine/homoserine/homoserine lactone efflux protein
MYVFVGVLGVLVGTAYLFERHYLFGAIYALFGAVWLMMSRKDPREEAARQPGGMDLGSPIGRSGPRVSTAENISKLSQS